MKKFSYFFIFFAISINAYAQYPPAVGQMGSTAIPKDSAIFVDWATHCSIERGYLICNDTTFEDPAYPGTNRASFGNDAAATGLADNNTVSLGDHGIAILTFTNPIVNGQGFDFAVFENSFEDYFLELAYVEVSSDGIHFVRFPSVSLTQTNTQIPGFGTLDPEKIHNLAGKYKVFYGTPFDLSDIQDSSGIDIQHITHVKIVDVIGSIDLSYANYDSQGHIINDPFPTPFWTGGFDLDAVGVIHNTQNTGINASVYEGINFTVYPNPASESLSINANFPSNYSAQLINSLGMILDSFNFKNSIKMNVCNLKNGLYFIILKDENNQLTTFKFLKN